MPIVQPILSEVGQLGKTHRFKGSLKIYFHVELKDPQNTPQFLWIYMEGKPVPYGVEEMTFTSSSQGIVLFSNVSFDDATKLNGSPLYIEEEMFNTHFVQQDDFSSFIAYTVIDKKNGLIGQIASILDQTEQIVFSVDQNGKEILIPYTEEIVTEIDHHQEEIHVSLPDGLLEIYL